MDHEWTPERFIAAVLAERARADELHPGTSDLPDSTDCPAMRDSRESISRSICASAQREGRLTFAHVFDEETAEVLTEAARGNVEELEKELIQVASLCLKWLQAIERRRAAGEGRR